MKPATLKMYCGAVNKFLLWCSGEGAAYATSVSDLHQLDRLLYYYVCWLCAAGFSKSLGTNAVYGVRLLLPSIANCLSWSVAALSGWNRLAPSSPHPPMTLEMATLYACVMAKNKRWVFGVGVLLAFHCYLRVGELCSLRTSDVILPSSVTMGSAFSGMALQLATTKTGDHQFVTVTDERVMVLLLAVYAQAQSCGRSHLFAFSPDEFRKCMHKVSAVLGLSHLRFVPHSLRHGGATRDFLLGKSLEFVLHRGRWASMASARHYIQAGRALLSQTVIPPRWSSLGAALTENLLIFFGNHSEVVRHLLDLS